MKSISFVLILFLLFTIPGYCIVPFLNKSENSSHHLWHLIWSDEFKTNQSIDKKWDAQNSSEGDILCSRWRENAIIKKHALRIINKKENKGGKNWTSARLISKEQFKYGYFECKMKISQSTGINNAFWFYSYPKGNEESFEIDGAEVHYPNKIQTNIHNWGNSQNKIHQSFPQEYITNDINLSEKYHIYGLLWTKDLINFYFDGNLIRTEKNVFCHSKASIVLSCAIMNWAGKITNNINGTYMQVDYIRAFDL